MGPAPAGPGAAGETAPVPAVATVAGVGVPGPLADLIAALGAEGITMIGAAAEGTVATGGSSAPSGEAASGSSPATAAEATGGPGPIGEVTAAPAAPTEPEIGGFAQLPAGLFAPTPEAISESGEEAVTGTELAAAAAEGSGADQVAEPEEDQDRVAGPRHVHDREVIWSLQRRMLEERERMGGFGALIR
jgi:hypothetical protein